MRTMRSMEAGIRLPPPRNAACATARSGGRAHAARCTTPPDNRIRLAFRCDVKSTGQARNCPECQYGHDADPFLPTSPRCRTRNAHVARETGSWKDPFLGSYLARAGVALTWARPIKYLSKGDELVDVYRFVSQAELDDIMRSGKFRLGPNSIEAKQCSWAVARWSPTVDPNSLKHGAITVPKEDLDMLNDILRSIDRV